MSHFDRFDDGIRKYQSLCEDLWCSHDDGNKYSNDCLKQRTMINHEND